MGVGEANSDRCVFCEPEWKLCLNRSSESVVPGDTLSGTVLIQIDVDLRAGGCGFTVNHLAYKKD